MIDFTIDHLSVKGKVLQVIKQKLDSRIFSWKSILAFLDYSKL
jgi:hypothetical protein